MKSTKSWLPILLCSCLLGVLGCNPVNVRSDFDVDADFSRYRSYRLIAGPSDRANEFLAKRINLAITDGMGKKGFVADAQAPDLLIAHSTSMQQRRDVFTSGSYRYWGPSHVDVYEYQEGTLVIDMIDAATSQMVWRGAATKNIYEMPDSPQEAQKAINKVVDKVLARFPPE